MKLLDIKKIEGCLEGTNVRDVLFSRPVGEDFIKYLGRLGKLIYNEQMEKPFFKVIVRGKYTLKGSAGNNTIRIILPESPGNIIESFGNYVEGYKDTQ